LSKPAVQRPVPSRPNMGGTYLYPFINQ
jgi:hypothetical protein